jgi:hypothetical protein
MKICGGFICCVCIDCKILHGDKMEDAILVIDVHRRWKIRYIYY